LAVGAHRYRWFYVCTFVEPETGESLSLLVDGMDRGVMGWVLQELRAWLGEGEVWVVLDRAGWHVFPKVEVAEGIRLVFLPPLQSGAAAGRTSVALGERGGGQPLVPLPRGPDGDCGPAVPDPPEKPTDPQAAHPVVLHLNDTSFLS